MGWPLEIELGKLIHVMIHGLVEDQPCMSKLKLILCVPCYYSWIFYDYSQTSNLKLQM